MGSAKKRIDPKILNHENRNFNQIFTIAAVKAVKQLPPPWKPNKMLSLFVTNGVTKDDLMVKPHEIKTVGKSLILNTDMETLKKSNKEK